MSNSATKRLGNASRHMQRDKRTNTEVKITWTSLLFFFISKSRTTQQHLLINPRICNIRKPLWEKAIRYYDPMSFIALIFLDGHLFWTCWRASHPFQWEDMKALRCEIRRELDLFKTSALVFGDTLSSFLTFMVDVQYIFMFHLAVLLLLR